MKSIATPGVGLFVALSLLACSSSSSPGAQAADGGTTGGADGGAAAGDAGAPAGLDCLSVLQCASACGANDDPCDDACLARGTTDAQAKANTLVNCLGTNQCDSPTCLQAHCSAEYDACVTPPAPTGGKPISGAAPAGSVPPDFVGVWRYTGSNRTDDFTFNADGTASRKQVETSEISGCSDTVAFENAGSVIFTPAKDGFTFYITTATNTASACGSPTTTPGTTGAFDFTLEAIPALGPGKYWFFRVQDCPVTAEVDKRVQCGNEFDLAP